MTLTTTNDSAPALHIDRAAIMRSLKLDPSDVRTQALVLVCQRYGIDPLLKHAVLIDGRPYITRDGYLTIAHDSGQFDGMEVLEEGEDATHWWARVAVYRKDMSRPFAFKGRYPRERLNSKGTNTSNVEYGPEMAVKVAEVAALRRAFNVTGAGAVDERWDTEPGHAARPEWLDNLQFRIAPLDARLRDQLADAGERIGIGRDWSGATEEGRSHLTRWVEKAEAADEAHQAHQAPVADCPLCPPNDGPPAIGSQTAVQADPSTEGTDDPYAAAEAPNEASTARSDAARCEGDGCDVLVPRGTRWCADHEPF